MLRGGKLSRQELREKIARSSDLSLRDKNKKTTPVLTLTQKGYLGEELLLRPWTFVKGNLVFLQNFAFSPSANFADAPIWRFLCEFCEFVCSIRKYLNLTFY